MNDLTLIKAPIIRLRDAERRQEEIEEALREKYRTWIPEPMTGAARERLRRILMVCVSRG